MTSSHALRRPLLTLLALTVSGLLVTATRADAVAPAQPANCPVPTTSTKSTTTPVAIPDDTTVADSPITVTGTTGTIFDVDVTTNIVHAAPQEITLWLTAPDGTRVLLSDANGGTNANAFAGTLWDDGADPGSPAPYQFAAGLVTDHDYSNGTVATPLVPDEGLIKLRGKPANGTWKLSASDASPGNVGSIDGWSIVIRTTTVTTSVTTSPAVSDASVTPIPDDGTAITRTFTYSGTATYLDDLRLSTNIAHQDISDLQVTLTSPTGTTVTIANPFWVGPGLADTFNGTTWTMTADPITVLTALPPSGTRLASAEPQESFGAFVGEDPRGVWTLRVADMVANNTGTLGAVSLTIDGAGPCPTPQISLQGNSRAPFAELGAAIPVGDQVRFTVTLPAGATVTASPTTIATTLSLSAPAGVHIQVDGSTKSPGAVCQSSPGAIGLRCTWTAAAASGERSVSLLATPHMVTSATPVTFTATATAFGQTTNLSRPVTVVPGAYRTQTGEQCTYVGSPLAENIVVGQTHRFPAGVPVVVCALDGDDRLTGDLTGPVVLEGGAGADTITGSNGNDTLIGADGNDTIDGRGGNDRIVGDAFDSRVGVDRISGGPGNDTIDAGGGGDIVDGGSGNDRILGRGGDDQLTGGPGADFVAGHAGNDRLIGSDGFDRLFGGPGNDLADGGAGPDVVRGEAGNDTLLGGSGADMLFGDLGDDRVTGGAGNDRLQGGAGNDRVLGSAGDDTVSGNAGRDFLVGGLGRDRLVGGPGRDTAIVAGDIAVGVEVRR